MTVRTLPTGERLTAALEAIYGPSVGGCTGVLRHRVTGVYRRCDWPAVWDVITRCTGGHGKAGPYCDGHEAAAKSGAMQCSLGDPVCLAAVSLVVATPLVGGS